MSTVIAVILNGEFGRELDTTCPTMEQALAYVATTGIPLNDNVTHPYYGYTYELEIWDVEIADDFTEQFNRNDKPRLM